MRDPKATAAAPRRLPALGNRLYVRIYLALLASLVLAAALFASLHWIVDPDEMRTSFDNLTEMAGKALPAPDAPRAEQQEALRRWRGRVHIDMALYSAQGELIGSAGRPLPPLPSTQAASGPLDRSSAVFALKLADGRWLLGKRNRGRRPFPNVLWLLGAVALVVAAGAYPVVRRLTGRLERLQGSVESWGAGRLSTRVAVEGRDEVARLATSFNHSAERIEALVAAQKSLLANASHELRSPLARIRMAVELLHDQADPGIRSEINQNIAELDLLIEEVLLASRLDSADASARHEAGATVNQAPDNAAELDLTGLVAEECARGGASFDGEALAMRGDARLLRRMVRNLLENAQRYGDGSSVVARLSGQPAGQLQLEVCDRGPGVPEAERERIFEPFYRVPGASESAGGVGLGLALVRQIARHHGGDVWCLANPEGGCCFRVQLPARL